jgi:hypothetical protein
VLGQSARTGTDGRYYTARVSVPLARLADGQWWRFWALSSGGDVQPSEWVEFEVRRRVAHHDAPRIRHWCACGRHRTPSPERAPASRSL